MTIPPILLLPGVGFVINILLIGLYKVMVDDGFGEVARDKFEEVKSL